MNGHETFEITKVIASNLAVIDGIKGAKKISKDFLNEYPSKY